MITDENAEMIVVKIIVVARLPTAFQGWCSGSQQAAVLVEVQWEAML